MNQMVEKGKTLLVDGPASVTVASGKTGVFGFKIGNASRIIIREGKRLPFTVEETATFNISLGEGASVEVNEGNSIPPSWAESYEKLASIQGKSITALVLGTVDSGKSSFCTYLINRLLREKKKVAILDGDLGQSDIGPPCTVSYTFVTRPVTDLFNLETKNVFFAGVTSPSTIIGRMIEGLTTLKKDILASNPDFLIINTDGWVEDEDAIYYKIKLVEELNPDMVFCIQQKDELAPLLGALEKFKKVMVDYPPAIGQRSKERRKNLRELGYIKYLRNSKVQSLPLSWLKVEKSDVFGLNGGQPNPRAATKIYALLGMKPLHYVESKDRVSVIIGKTRWIGAENLKKAEEFTKKKVTIIRKGEEEGILLGLYDAKRKFKGIGVLQEIDYLRKTLKILTPVSKDIAIIAMGKLKLDRSLKEIQNPQDENELRG